MASLSIEKTILSSLVKNESYSRQVLPYLQEEYFLDKVERSIFVAIDEYFKRSNTLPQKSILLIEIEESRTNDSEIEQAKSIIDELYSIETINDFKWLVDQSEVFCREKAMYNAITEAIQIYDGSNKNISPHAIPELMREALSINFDTRIGQDWYEDANDRWDRYTNPEDKIQFDLSILNDITLGGVTRKTLSVILGGVHVGKSMCLVHLACGYARMGFNVLYFTMEMSEDAVMQRIDANLLNVAIHKIQNLGSEKFLNRITSIKQKSNGTIKVKEFPTSSANVNHFKHVINELSLKKRWTPDVIIVDYIGITASAKLKVGQTNSHFYLKSVAEELRALGIETNTIVWSAMQLTRGGMTSNDAEMTDIAESIGIPAVSDLMFSIYRDENMDNVGQFMVKQLKNRFRDKGYKLKFIIGCERDKQLLFDVSGDAQTLVDEKVDIDMGAIQGMYKSSASKRFGDKKKFTDFNFESGEIYD